MGQWLTTAAAFMALLIGSCGILLIVSRIDQRLQRLRGIPANSFGRRPDGLVAKLALLAVVGSGVALMLASGAEIDPEIAPRR